MKNNFPSLLWLVIGTLLFTAACTSPQKDTTPPPFDLTAAKTAIAERNRVLIDFLSKGDSVGAANCYTVDAKFMENHAPATVGRKNIQTAYASMINQGLTGLQIQSIDLWGNENMLVEEAIWSLRDKDGKELDHGKQIEVYKMEDGTWKIFRDCFNSDMPLHQ